MNSKFKEKIIYWLREASDMGCRGFMYDRDLPKEQQEDYLEFEEEAIQNIENYMFNLGMDNS